MSQRSPNPNFSRCPPKPPLASESPAPSQLQLNNSATLGATAGGSGLGRPTGKVTSIENLRSKEPVNLMRSTMGQKSDVEKRGN